MLMGFLGDNGRKQKNAIDIDAMSRTHIDDLLNLSGRAKKVCRQLEIKTIRDLSGWTRYGLMSQPGVGKVTFNELERLLLRSGMHWGNGKSESYLKHGGGR